MIRLHKVFRKPSPLRATKDDFAEQPTSNKNFLRNLKSGKEFDLFARTFHRDTPYAVPHIMFLIDLDDRKTPYYINSKKFKFHSDFARQNHLTVLQ